MSVSTATLLHFIPLEYEELISVILTDSLIIVTRCVRLDESGSSSAHGE